MQELKQNSKDLLKEYLIFINFILCLYNQHAHLLMVIPLFIYSKHFYWLPICTTTTWSADSADALQLGESLQLAHACSPCPEMFSHPGDPRLIPQVPLLPISWLNFVVSKHKLTYLPKNTDLKLPTIFLSKRVVFNSEAIFHHSWCRNSFPSKKPW